MHFIFPFLVHMLISKDLIVLSNHTNQLMEKVLHHLEHILKYQSYEYTYCIKNPTCQLGYVHRQYRIIQFSHWVTGLNDSRLSPSFNTNARLARMERDICWRAKPSSDKTRVTRSMSFLSLSLPKGFSDRNANVNVNYHNSGDLKSACLGDEEWRTQNVCFICHT